MWAPFNGIRINGWNWPTATKPFIHEQQVVARPIPFQWYFLSTSAPKWVPIEKRWVPMQNGSSATLWRLSWLGCHGLDVENLRGSTWLQLWETCILSVDDEATLHGESILLNLVLKLTQLPWTPLDLVTLLTGGFNNGNS